MKLRRKRCAPSVGMITITCKDLVGNPDGENLLRICIHRGNGNIKVGLK
jgi:hypothetical protein